VADDVKSPIAGDIKAMRDKMAAAQGTEAAAAAKAKVEDMMNDAKNRSMHRRLLTRTTKRSRNFVE